MSMRKTTDYKKFCVDVDSFEGVDQVVAYELNERIKKYYFLAWVLPFIQRDHSMDEVRDVMKKILTESVDFYQRKREEFFAQYEDMASMGKPFEERKKWLDEQKGTLDTLKGLQDEALSRLDGFRVRPFNEWMEPGDDELIESKGFEEFIRFKHKMCFEIIK